MKLISVCFLFILFYATSFATPKKDSLIDKLNNVIKQASFYDSNKLKIISELKNLSKQISKSDLDSQYDVILKLYEEYKYYNYDSALTYAKKLQQLALNKNNSSLLLDSKLRQIFIMLSGGMFKETFDSLNVISISNVADSVKSEYYTLMGRSYYNLADFNADSYSTTFYNNKANFYLDSALTFFAPNSFDHLYYSALKFLKKGDPDSALANLHQLIERNDLSYHQTALSTSTIGGILMSQGFEDKAKLYLIEASIADIKSSTKETLALLQLSGIVYKEGKIEEALLYSEKANADAAFYNARLRKVQVGAILPLIEGGMINTIKSQKQKLQYFLFVLSVLVILLAGFAVIIRSQVKKLKTARANLFKANEKQQQINKELLKANELKEKYNSRLTEINNQLLEANETKEKYNEQLKAINYQLTEANKIKEEYIGYYFNLDTEYLARTEKLIVALDKKLVERRWGEIKLILKSFDPKKEKEELLRNFDKIFLRLFPNFVAQFNTMFSEEDKIILKDEQLLNAELRIFALIRIGITENEKIAEILGYSINTIYSKKTKIRSKIFVNKDEFERRIVEITTLTF